MGAGSHFISLQNAGNDTATRPTASKTSAYSASIGDLVLCNTTGGAFTVTLPDVSDGQRGIVTVKVTAGSANVTVDGYSAQTVDGVASIGVSPGSSVTLVADGDGHWISSAGAGFTAGEMAVNTVAASGTAQTIPEPTLYGFNDITLTGNVTLTLPSTTKGKTLRFVFRQDGTGSRTVSWPAGTKYPGGSLTITATASAVDYVTAISVVEGTWMVYRNGAAFA